MTADDRRAAWPGTEGEVHWAHCPSCGAAIYLRRLQRHEHVCPECSHHWRIGVDQRLAALLDTDSFTEIGADLASDDPLDFVDTKPYTERVAAARRRTGSQEAVRCGTATIEGHPLVVAALDFRFLGGSIGATTGEKICLAARTALARRIPLLVVCASGGARMQEGALSLMQLARTSQEIARLREAGVACINLNTDPTYGGATASFAMLGDVVVAEPAARIGFAGPDVVEQTIREKLPDRFQTAEFLAESGMVDLVVPRPAQRGTLARLLCLLGDPHGAASGTVDASGSAPVVPLGGAAGGSAWDVVRSARNLQRPTARDYCRAVFDDFVELHGDRLSGDDQAVVGGLARLDGRTVVAVGTQKGHTPTELVENNFGMPQPGGYHKARRMMTLAERLGVPVVTFVDTPGAFPGAEAEERGQGTAIAECILAMSRLEVPTVALVTGEGGSGGALSLAVGNRVLLLENAYYSVISPEGCATILWGEAAAASTAAEVLHLTAPQLHTLGVVDRVVGEPAGGAAADPAATAHAVRAAVTDALAELVPLPPEEVVADRHARFARFGAPGTALVTEVAS
ncbi:acetyl-CoA carboxylase, carboxyltransferase subunit beta [Actinomycetospora aeridis]|uniref:Multifunctional fusion protein n=1 Tax=Actinomycetospora aeridis TaxID=3129231 RepID=A0ABU8N7W0_9PSEU